MSTAVGSEPFLRRTQAYLPVSIWVPLLGIAWVLLNVLLIAMGIRDAQHSGLLYKLLAGGIDGGTISVIMVAA